MGVKKRYLWNSDKFVFELVYEEKEFSCTKEYNEIEEPLFDFFDEYETLISIICVTLGIFIGILFGYLTNWTFGFKLN